MARRHGAMLKIRQLKAQQDAEKAAAAESGTPAQPKQTPGQLRIQKGELIAAEPTSAFALVAELTSDFAAPSCPDVGDLNFDHTDTIEVDFPNPVCSRIVTTRALSCCCCAPCTDARPAHAAKQSSAPGCVANCGGLLRMI